MGSIQLLPHQMECLVIRVDKKDNKCQGSEETLNQWMDLESVDQVLDQAAKGAFEIKFADKNI